MEVPTSENGWYCYILETKSGPHRVYTGATNNLYRRLRQHNAEQAGGARHTRLWGPDNAKLAILLGPMTQTAALAIERRLKQKITRGGGLRGRLKAVVQLLRQHTFRSRSVTIPHSELKQMTIRTAASDQDIAKLAGLRVSELSSLADWRFGAFE